MRTGQRLKRGWPVLWAFTALSCMRSFASVRSGRFRSKAVNKFLSLAIDNHSRSNTRQPGLS